MHRIVPQLWLVVHKRLDPRIVVPCLRSGNEADRAGHPPQCRQALTLLSFPREDRTRSGRRRTRERGLLGTGGL